MSRASHERPGGKQLLHSNARADACAKVRSSHVLASHSKLALKPNVQKKLVHRHI